MATTTPLGRRRFLGVLAIPAIIQLDEAVPVQATVDAVQRPSSSASAADPQIMRLASLDIDEMVEPALVFLPRGQ